MGVIKGNLASNIPTTKDVTVTEDGDKVGLDVTVVSGNISVGTGSGMSMAGSNALASGSLLYGLEYKAIEAAIGATVDTYTIYSDSAKTNLISTLVITYTDATKDVLVDAVRTDV